MEKQILDLEKKYWDGMANHDFETVKHLTYFPCIVASKEGVKSIDEPTFKALFDRGKGVKMSINAIKEAVTQVFSNSYAVIGYVIDIETNHDGKSSTGSCYCTSTWILENGEWKCIMHSEGDLK